MHAIPGIADLPGKATALYPRPSYPRPAGDRTPEQDEGTQAPQESARRRRAGLRSFIVMFVGVVAILGMLTFAILAYSPK